MQRFGAVLVRKRLLRTGAHHHLARKGRPALAVEHIFEEHVGGAGFGHMIHQQVVVHLLMPVGDGDAGRLAIGLGAEQSHIGHRARNAGGKSQSIEAHAAASLLFYVDIG